MKILGIQKHHLSSACLFIDEKLIYYNQEERLSRKKRDYGIPFFCLEEIKKICNTIDKVVITGYNFNREENQLISSFLRKIGFKFHDEAFFWFSDYKCHHISHAYKAFYSSPFDEALVVVWDGRGSTFSLNDGSWAYETTSAYTASLNKFDLVYKRLYTTSKNKSAQIVSKIFPDEIRDVNFIIPNDIIDMKNDHDIGHLYGAVSQHCGFGIDECGKLMGLQSYGKYNSKLPKIHYVENGNYRPNEDLFLKENPKTINTDLYPMLKNENHNTENLIDFSFHTQKTFEEIGLHLLKKLIDKTNCENLILTGGCSLNVVANNFFRKNISSKINFYIEPICSDDGNCIGAVQSYLKPKQKNILNSIYLGPRRNYEIRLKSNEKCFDNVSKKYIAELLNEKNIVALFQGGAEAGPRALGNRSILFDPRVENGKDIVNVVKKREWFRPFACTVLLEHSKDWFDMHCLNESPYMMYALDALPGVKEKIPSVIHIDNTCRVQTLTEEQNLHFYELIEEFYELTGVPLLLNTSFNLAGDPMVETIEDALETLRKSELEYLYLPELEKLIYIENKGKDYVKT